jgi:hypothetical protein
MRFVNRNSNMTMETDFWAENPQIRYITPFDDLYPMKESSKIAWWIYFMKDPDEAFNKFYRLPEKQRMETLNKNLINVDLSDPIIRKCYDIYDEMCLTSVQRALKQEINNMVKRSDFIDSLDYTHDKHVGFAANGQPQIIPGTAKMLDSMRSQTKKIFDDYKRIEEMFFEEKNENEVYGGRKESISEKGLL